MPDSRDRMFERALASDFPYCPEEMPSFMRHPSIRRKGVGLYHRNFPIIGKKWPEQAKDYIDMLRADAKMELEHYRVLHLELGIERDAVTGEPAWVGWFAYAYREEGTDSDVE